MSPSSKFVCVLTATLAFAVAAVAKPKLDKELRRAFVGKTYTLRSTCPKSVLNFNAAGEITDDCRPGNWALYSAFHIDGISRSENKLTVSGKRLIGIGTAVAADEAVGLDIPDPYRLVLNFQISAPVTDVPSVTAVITRAFESEEERAAELAPYEALFRAVPMLPMHQPPAKAVPPPCGEIKPIGMLGPDRPVYPNLTGCLEAGYENPKALEARRDPANTDVMPEVFITGDGALLLIVVNERGRPEILKIVRRVGLGLDENKIKQVAAWKFDPAKLAGKPIAVPLWVQFTGASHLH